MAEASKIGPGKENRARLRLQGPRPRPLSELATSSYSAFVGTMKVVLPAVAVGLILLVLAWPQFRAADQGFRVGISKIMSEDAQNLRMINPRYQGLDKKGEPFTITASIATKAKPSSDVVELEKPQADVTLTRGNWVTLRADFGTYREQDQLLDLIGAVDLFHDAGYEFRTLSAHANLANNTAEGSDPVHGQGPFGEIRSQGFRIYDKGDRVVFTGKAWLLLRPRAEPPTGGR